MQIPSTHPMTFSDGSYTVNFFTLEQKSLHLPGVQLAEKSNRNAFLTGDISIEGVVVECRYINTFLKHLAKASF